MAANNYFPIEDSTGPVIYVFDLIFVQDRAEEMAADAIVCTLFFIP